MLGSINVTSDIKLVEDVLYSGGVKVVIVDEENPFQGANNIVVMGSVLLPPYEALAAMIDGETRIFAQIYHEYLCRREPESFIVLLITCLYRGMNILLFIPDQEADFLQPLLYQFALFGIIVGSVSNVFMINPQQEPQRVILMYLYDYITADEYLKMLPINVPIDERVLPLLIRDINPHLPVYSKDDYLRYFENYRHRVINSNKPIIVPFTRCV